MQENEFEKRLQQEMGEFRLRPSDVVWDKIEEQIRKKKRRRVVFFISLLAGFSLLGYIGYFLFNDKKQTLTEQNVTTIETNKTENNKIENENNQAAEPLQKSASEDQTTIKQDRPIGEEQIATKENKTRRERKNQTDANDIVKTAKDVNKEKIATEKFPAVKKRSVKLGMQLKKEDLADIKNKDSEEKILDQRKEKNNNPVSDKNIVSKTDEEKNLNGEIKPFPDQKQNIVAKTNSAVAATTKQSSKAPARRKNKIPPTINWGIDLSIGVSQIRNKAFSFPAISQNSDRLYADVPGGYTGSTGSNSGGGTGGAINNPFFPPSAVKRGIAFKVGFIGEKKISRKSSVAVGLSYAYYSNSIKTGATKDTSFILRNMASQDVALNAYYQGSQQKEYTNRYHFIQVPVNYQLQLNKGIKLPVMWNIGASAGWLVSTNALVYDTASGGIYYRNRDAFNKLHFNFNTGLSLRFGRANRLQWSVGPELSMDMTGLIKDAPDQKRYFLYGGITGRLFFTKKNNK